MTDSPTDPPLSPDHVPTVEDWGALLADQTAIVTGGAAGIGAAICRLFARHGACVEIVDHDAEGGERTRAQILDAGGIAHLHVRDVTAPDAARQVVDSVMARRGRLDVLVNNVGDYRPLTDFEDSDPAHWAALYRVNVEHVFAMSQAAVAAMKPRRSGSIVTVHSVEAVRAYPREPVYAAMKAAAAHFTTSLAVTVGRYGIRVNGVAPDLTTTDQVDFTAPEHAELWPAWAPAGRPGWPEEQARAALFLASPLASFVTGHNLPVDGGTLARNGWLWSRPDGRFTNRPYAL
jgi:NAD(P)-dependent dehydrogenase (short-subunit alcohol dehydrogenase family)